MTWFRPKTYGYGAAPSSWQGWLAVAVFVALELLLARVLLGFSDDAGLGRVIGFLAASAILVAGFMRLSRSQTSGGWGGLRGAAETRQMKELADGPRYHPAP